MEQFRQIGEVVGSLNALMMFKDDIQINRRQCSLLFDMLTSAYESIGQQMKQNLKFEEKNTKWKLTESPLKELHRVFKEAELYIKQCMETKDWWAKAITLHKNTDCVEIHIHNLLSYIPTVIESIEIAGEISGLDHEEIAKKKAIYSTKYCKDYKDPKLFKWRFGNEYLVSQEFCGQLESVWEEDRWLLIKKMKEKKGLLKQDQQLVDLLLKSLDESEKLDSKLLPSSILVNSKDYQVKRRLGSGSRHKEIQWLGESFALRHFFGNIEPLIPEICRELSHSHPNVIQIYCGFTDEERKECFLVTELMNRDLSSYIREISGPRKRNPFSLPTAVDLMLQIARGMEYLHSKKIYHGNLKPKNILIKTRNVSTDRYLHAKVSKFGPSSFASHNQKGSSNQNGTTMLPFIWYAPEVLAEQEDSGSYGNSKYTEKSDVYSFGMICFELLTGKVPFEDGHLHGDQMSRNIRAGERPLFPFNSPKYLTNLTKRCWHTDPNQRPSFSSICRILRYLKRFLAMNPDHSQADSPSPAVDYCDIEVGLLKNFWWGSLDPSPVSQIPYQMFTYKVMEKEKLNTSQRENSESGSDGASACGDENMAGDDTIPSPTDKKSSTCHENVNKKPLSSKKFADTKASTQPGTPKGRAVRPPQMSTFGRRMRMNSESHLVVMSPKTRRSSGHVSDSELP